MRLSEVGERHQTAVADPMDPNHAVLDIHLVEKTLLSFRSGNLTMSPR